MVLAGSAAPRMARWLSTWGKHDPYRPHSHFGPLAVDLDLQGEGIGSLLLTTYCRRLDDAGTGRCFLGGVWATSTGNDAGSRYRLSAASDMGPPERAVSSASSMGPPFRQ